MSSDVLIPDWIKRIKATDDLEKAQAEANKQKQAAGLLLIEAEGPVFWKKLLEELQITVNALHLIGIRGSISTTGNIGEEQCCQVDILRQSIFPAQTYTNIFYSKRNGTVVRCHTLEDESFRLTFCIDGKRISLLPDHGAPLSEKEAAEFIVKRMVEMVSER